MNFIPDVVDKTEPPNKVKIKTPKQAKKESDRVRDKIERLAKCSRHGGESGQDCFLCKMEGIL